MTGYIVLLSILSVVLLIVVIFLFKRCQYLYNKNVELTDKYKELTQKELKTAAHKQSAYVELSLKNLMLANNTYVIDNILQIADDKHHDVRSAIKNYIKRGDDGKSEFLDCMREVTQFKAPGAIKAIKRIYPELSESDIDLYCMSYIGVTISTICFVLDCSSQTLYNKKCQLRKRLEINDSKLSLKKHFEKVVSTYNHSMGLRVT